MMSTNSYGFDGEIPEGAEWAAYDIVNGEMTGFFWNTLAEAEAEAKRLASDPENFNEDGEQVIAICSLVSDSGWL